MKTTGAPRRLADGAELGVGKGIATDADQTVTDAQHSTPGVDDHRPDRGAAKLHRPPRLANRQAHVGGVAPGAPAPRIGEGRRLGLRCDLHASKTPISPERGRFALALPESLRLACRRICG
jgi:hypothetical protein